jgi:hypothetical protein
MKHSIRKLATVLLALCASAAATSYNGTLTAPVAAGTTSSVTWSGSVTGATGEMGQGGVITPICTSLTCDIYTLTVNVPATFYAANPNYAVHVQTSATPNTSVTDIDIYIYDSAGNLVCQSTSPSPSEDADCGQLASGTYEIDIAPLLATNQAYNGKIILEQEPATTIQNTGNVRYKKGNFTFGAPTELVRPNNLTSTGGTGFFFDTDGEPRVVHDALGNLYVAATQGVPAGSDMWSSTDGGTTWNYLGEPDGAQAANVLTGINGNGLGGGDEDVITLPNGQVDMSSLWLGSNTTCVSNTAGHAWVCNPNGNMLPADDRQWLANYGDNIVYITTKQLGAVIAGPSSLYVAKSTDGGVTFPTVSLVANSAVNGIDPGDQGNIVVDSKGNVYNVYFDSSGQRLYIAKSIDGGVTWMNKMVYAAPPCTPTLCINLVHVFPSVAVDSANNLYIVFSDGTNSLYTSSSDGGASWRLPTIVNSAAGVKSAMEPWVVAGDAGKVNVFYYGTTAHNFMDPTAKWYVYMAQSQNALAKVPTFSSAAATPYVIHSGAICTNGTGCPSGTRTMLEYFFPDTFIDGNADAVYPDSEHVRDATAPNTTVWFIKQTGGSKIVGR